MLALAIEDPEAAAGGGPGKADGVGTERTEGFGGIGSEPGPGLGAGAGAGVKGGFLIPHKLDQIGLGALSVKEKAHVYFGGESNAEQGSQGAFINRNPGKRVGSFV